MPFIVASTFEFLFECIGKKPSKAEVNQKQCCDYSYW